ncbi:MAG: YitT family protein [Bacteroidales bacterium]|nr:YitT family protein [Bacteroidales bacterium]
MQKKSKIGAWFAQLNDSTEKFGSKEWFKAYGMVVLGTFIFVLGDIMFANPYHLAPGGTYGLSNVLNALFPWKLSFYVVCLDLPLLILGLIILGPKFGVKTLLSVFLGYIFTYILETTWGYAPFLHVGEIVNSNSLMPHEGMMIEIGQEGRYFFPDYMLNTVVAGVVYGLGIGLIFKAGATSGGSDIISMIIHKYTKISLGTMVIIVDGLISLSSFIINQDFRFPLYSVILVYIEGKVIDMIVPPVKKDKQEKEVPQKA